MAGMAIEAAVCPCQRVASLRVVIEAPSRPAIRVVAKCAISPEAPLMMHVTMAGSAIQRRALECLRAMAPFARHDGVAPNQRKSCDVVIERRHAAPSVFTVTRLATTAELTIVPIILTVTGYAGSAQLIAIKIAGMARVALDLCMCSSERIFRHLIMVEANRAPLVLIMARFALCTVPSAVDVLNLVAGDTRGANSFVAFAAVACRT